MKNNKGFTLVEILAVVAILAIIMIIAVPNVLGSLNAGKNAISNIEKKAIKDATERAMLEALNCENDSFIKNDLKQYYNSDSCQDFIDFVTDPDNEVTINLGQLKTNGYLDDVSFHCNEDGEIYIKTDSNFRVTVTLANNLDCKK